MKAYKWPDREAWLKSIERWENYWKSFKSNDQLAEYYRSKSR